MSIFRQQLLKQIRERNVVVVAGTGVSAQMAAPSEVTLWTGLLRYGIRHCAEVERDLSTAWVNNTLANLESGDKDTLLATASLVRRKLSAHGGEFASWIKNSVGSLRLEDPAIAHVLDKIGTSIATTNYDNLLAEALNRPPVTWRNWTAVGDVLRGESKSIMHLHGHVSELDSLILGEQDYERLLQTHPAQVRQQFLAYGKTLLFVGFGSGLNDPNFEQLTRWLSISLDGDSHFHYQLVLNADVSRVSSKRPGNMRVLGYGDSHAALLPWLKEVCRDAGLDSSATSPPSANRVLRSAAAAPALPRMPQLDPDADYVRQFIGREPCLGIVADAMSGLQARAQRRPLLSESSKPKVIWTCGIGGMGKSWLLRHIAWSVRNRHPNIKVCLVDWDDADWRSPLSGQPSTAEDLFNAIAERLAQLYGADKLDGWWNASARVRAGSGMHRDLQIRMLHCELILIESGKDWRDSRRLVNAEGVDKRLVNDVSVLELELRNAKLWSDEPARLAERLKVFSRTQRDELFISWANSILDAEATDEVVQPARFLAKAFSETLITLVSENPLLVILDTCELFGLAQDDLDFWLRHAAIPVLRDESPFLLIVGSRGLPDSSTDRPASARWRTTVPQSKFKTLNLDDIAFTSDEIAVLVRRAGLSPSLDEAAVDKIETMTRGVPLAVALMLDYLHTKESVPSATMDIDEWAPPDLLNASDAAEQVIRVMAKRFLHHLEDHPERIGDFADVMALGLLLKADLKVLRAYWNVPDAPRRLRELNRYALVSGNDLHLEVRGFVRNHWRMEPPAELSEVATRLLAVVSNRPDCVDHIDLPSLALEKLNLASWISKKQLDEKICLTIAIFYAAEKSAGAIEDFLSELGGDHADARDLLTVTAFDLGYFGPREPTIDALKRAKELATTAHEKASCALLCAMSLTSLALSSARRVGRVERRALDLFEEAVTFFVEAIDHFKDDLPHRSRVVRNLLEAAAYCVRDQRKVDAASRVYEILQRTGALNDANPTVLSVILSGMNRRADAEAVLRRGIENDPGSDTCWHVLAHLLADQNRHDDADSAFERAAQLDSSDAGNWWCWACFKENRKDWQAAEPLYSRAIVEGKNDLETRLKLALARVKQKPAPESLENLETAIGSLDGADSKLTSLLNSVSWGLYLVRAQLPLARTLALTAHELDTGDLHILHTLVAVLLRRKDWAEAEPYLVRMMEMTQPRAGTLNYEECIVPLLQDVAELDAAIKAMVLTCVKRFPKWEEVMHTVEGTPPVASV